MTVLTELLERLVKVIPIIAELMLVGFCQRTLSKSTTGLSPEESITISQLTGIDAGVQLAESNQSLLVPFQVKVSANAHCAAKSKNREIIQTRPLRIKIIYQYKY
jgi:hypothetical protein